MPTLHSQEPAPAAATVMPASALMEIQNIRKAFPGVVALDNVSFQLQAGTVHGGEWRG
jgi:inositol transport system ATP-binding protein